MYRFAVAAAVVCLACGSARDPASTSLSFKTTRVEMRAGETRTLEFIPVGLAAEEVSLRAIALPSFATLDGACLTLAPRDADAGSHAIELVATAAGQTGTTTITVNVADACGGCPAGQTCGGGGSGVCSLPRWSRWADVFGTQGDDSVSELAVDAAGNLHAAGTSNGRDLFLRKYAAAGALLEEQSWPSTAPLRVTGFGVSPDGAAVVAFQVQCACGSTCDGPDLGAGAPHGSVLAKLDASGALLWQLDSGPYDAQCSAAPRTVYEGPAIAPSGDVAVLGEDAAGAFVAVLDASGKELWRQSRPPGRWGGKVVVDRQGRVTAFTFSPDVQNVPSLAQYDASGKALWEIQPAVAFGSIATAGDARIALVGGSGRLDLYRSDDGALLRDVALPQLWNGRVVADANRVVILGNSGSSGCAVYLLDAFDLAGTPLSTRPFANGCTGPNVYALALSAGDAVVGGDFDIPFDFGTGTDFAPRGRDAFVVDVRWSDG
jgi:putative pyrroloquinoline-quinone binding quinoprotein